jgi:hypothetical protein
MAQAHDMAEAGDEESFIRKDSEVQSLLGID